MIVILKKRKTHFSHLTHLPAHGQRQQRKKVAKSVTLPTDTYEVRANFRSVQLTAWKALMWVKNIFRFWEILLSKHSLFQNKYSVLL